jgi:hypothetical protein
MYCPSAPRRVKSKYDGVFENTLTGDTTGALSLPDRPRSVSVCRKLLFDCSVRRWPIVVPTLPVIDCLP